MRDTPPRRIFLDTSVVNLILENSESIHCGVPVPEHISQRRQIEIHALANIFHVGQRAFWELAVSPLTYHEVMSTNDLHKKGCLESWFAELWNYWREILCSHSGFPSFLETEEIRLGLLSSGLLDVLPNDSDRMLVIDSIVYK